MPIKALCADPRTMIGAALVKAGCNTPLTGRAYTNNSWMIRPGSEVNQMRTSAGRRGIARRDVDLLLHAKLPLSFEQRMALGRLIDRSEPKVEYVALAHRIRSIIEECEDPRNTKRGVLNVSELDDLRQACAALEG